MATAAVRTELEILDVRHFTARQLRPLLENEARVWQQRLRWNYSDATELLLQYLDSRILPGFVALDRGKICGFTFCVYEGYKAVVGDAFAVDNNAMSAIETTQELLRQLLQVLRHSPEIHRIEAQLLLYDSAVIVEPFQQAQFDTHRRLFMEVGLRARAGIPAIAPLPTELELRRWMPADYQPAAELIHASYEGHIDARINDQYCSLAGSLRFLHNIVRFPGCGVFEAKSSWVITDRSSRALVGVVLCSRVQLHTAHITQLCIAPRYRGRRLGAHLLRHSMNELARAGCEAITLTVTEANGAAVELYLDSGFEISHTFDAYVFDARNTVLG
jgi:ribosomal protein S18 acetylase RimI-like enzyme